MLADVTVVEIGSRISTRYCGRLLADAGATVVHVGDTEPPPATGPEFAACLHAGKEQVTIEPVSELPAAMPELAARADVLLCDDDNPAVLALATALRAQRPDLVMVALSDYGLDGPVAGAPRSPRAGRRPRAPDRRTAACRGWRTAERDRGRCRRGPEHGRRAPGG